MLYLDNDLNFIKLSFNKPIYKNFTDIFFTVNKNIIYYDNSHLNYIYEEIVNNIKYSFHGFFKNNFFTIILNSFDEELNINIESKIVILIKLDWIIKKLEDNKRIWIIDKTKLKDITIDSIILPIRNKFFEDENISIDDYIKIINHKIIKVNIDVIDKINKFSIKKKIYSILNFYNERK